MTAFTYFIYFNINYAIVWDTVKDDLPFLKKSIKKIL